MKPLLRNLQVAPTLSFGFIPKFLQEIIYAPRKIENNHGT